jgi:hypothetical protein
MEYPHLIVPLRLLQFFLLSFHPSMPLVERQKQRCEAAGSLENMLRIVKTSKIGILDSIDCKRNEFQDKTN